MVGSDVGVNVGMRVLVGRGVRVGVNTVANTEDMSVADGECRSVDSGSTAVGSGVLTGETNSVGLHAVRSRSRNPSGMNRAGMSPSSVARKRAIHVKAHIL
jgi:hypothetical protein